MIEVTVYETADDIEALRAEWDALLAEASCDYSASHTPDFVATAWRSRSAKSWATLAIVTARRGGRLVMVWPLQLRREGRGTCATHLGFGADEDYAGPIMSRRAIDREACRAGFDRAKTLADVLRVYNVRGWPDHAELEEGDGHHAPKGPTERCFVASDRSFRREGRALSPVASTHCVSDTDVWLRARSKNLFNWLRTARRRLEEKGALRFERMAGPVDGAAAAHWMLRFKRAWLEHGKQRSRWLGQGDGEAFFAAMASRPPGPGVDPVEIWALTLDGEPIAACVLFNSQRRSEFAVTTYDPAHSDNSPGILLIQDCVRLAARRGLDLDFRLTHDDYKMRWADRQDPYDTFVIACSPRGHLIVAQEIVEKAVRRFRAKWGPVVKGRLARALRPSRPR